MHQRSHLGSILDKVQTSTLIVCLLAGVLVAGALFYVLSPYGHGFTPNEANTHIPGFLESLYFSIVTVSSLGYGDYRPVGYGRLLAVTEVLYGLFFLAAIVSKLASERTSTLVKLVYASDTQRRLLEFVDSQNERNEELKSAVADHDYFAVSDVALRNKTAFATFKHFVNYHHKYGDIGNDWDTRQLVRLVRAAGQSVDLANIVIRQVYTDSELHVRLQNYINRAITFTEKVSNWYSSDHIDRILAHMEVQRDAYTRSISSCNGNFANLRGKGSPPITENLISRVQEVTPPRPWPDHVHKVVAGKLKISNKLAERVIALLLDRGEFPPDPKEEGLMQE